MDFQAIAKKQVEDGTASEATKRCVDLDTLATEQGFNQYVGSEDGQTFFSWGTELDHSGKQQFRNKAKLKDSKPFVSEIVDVFKQLIEKENRTDLVVNTGSVNYNGAQSINIDGKFAGMPVSRWALGQLLNRAKAPAGTLNVLSPSDPDTKLLPLSLAQQVFANYMEGKSQVKLRHREFPRNEVFAALSPKSPNFDGNVAVEAFAKFAMSTAKGDFQYDGRKWKISASVGTHIEPTVGEIFEAYVWISGCDDGSGAIKIGADVVRVRCVNLTTLTSSEVKSIRHTGKQENLEARINEALQKAFSKIEKFSDMWKNAEITDIADNMAEHGAEKTFLALAKKRLVYIPGVSAEEMAERLFTAWSAEPGYSKKDVLNAITRAAHSNSWDNPWATQSLAEQAGQMLYNRVYVTERDFSLLEIE